jgi:hypothetical protein
MAQREKDSLTLWPEEVYVLGMAIIWLTYAHADNQDRDVDYFAQELTTEGLQVHLDRWTIGAGRRLWEQIEDGIKSSDAWIIFASTNSLGSEPCKEELAYALDKALGTRGDTYPVMALFPATIDASILPLSLKTRLCVSVADHDWKERITSAAQGRSPQISRPILSEYVIKVHRFAEAELPFIIELRPRAGVWCPVTVAVPAHEGTWGEEQKLTFGGKDAPSPGSAAVLFDVGIGAEGEWAFIRVGGQQASPTFSAYVHCKRLPSKLLFGSGAETQYIAEELDGAIRVIRASRPNH